MIKTRKLYYENVFFSECESRVEEISEKGVVLDQTVAFPEGGGQKGDSGNIMMGESLSVPFSDTLKGVGRVVYLENFPAIQVENSIYHVIAGADLSKFKVGDSVKVRINIEQRARTTIAHTGIHLVLMGIEELYPGITKSIKGAYITDEYARLDFRKQEKFGPDDLEKITDFVNTLVDRDEPVMVFPHEEEPEAWYWQCRERIYPCGGTHLTSARYVGHVQIRRKNLGKGAERIIATFPSADVPLHLYT